MALEVHVVTPERELWSGEADMVVGRGVDGEVGILQGHQPLLLQLAIGALRVYLPGGSSEVVVVVDGGFLHVANEEGGTRVDVLASYAEMEDEVDVEAARVRAAEIQAHLAGTDLTDDQIESGKAELQKAVLRMGLAG